MTRDSGPLDPARVRASFYPSGAARFTGRTAATSLLLIHPDHDCRMMADVSCNDAWTKAGRLSVLR